MPLNCFILGKTAFSNKKHLCCNLTGQLCVSAKIIPFVYLWLSPKPFLLPELNLYFLICRKEKSFWHVYLHARCVKKEIIINIC